MNDMKTTQPCRSHLRLVVCLAVLAGCLAAGLSAAQFIALYPGSSWANEAQKRISELKQ